jgi:signal transduction histidine kinase
MLNKTSRHDLYNTFTAIQLNLALYNRGNQKQKRLNSVMAQAKKGQALIEKTKQLEGAFKTGAKLKVYSITGILKKVIQNYPNTKFNLKGKGTVFADEALYFVFDNIIANAKTHGQADSITINVKNSQQFVSVMVIDNGKGIPKAIINNLFQEGFTYGKSGNSGIGLYIVKKTIERYGGKVTAKAHKPNGAVFSIELPSAQ